MEVVLFSDYLYIRCDSIEKARLKRYAHDYKIEYQGIIDGINWFRVDKPDYEFLHWLSCIFDYQVI